MMHSLYALAVNVDTAYNLTVGGWITMLLSVGFVTGLTGWCIWRVMRESSAQKLHGQVDIETPDTKDD